MYRIWIWFFIILFLVNPSLAEVASANIKIQQDIDHYDIHENMEIYEDKEGNLTFEEISASSFSKNFVKNNGGIPSNGYTSTVFWLRFEIENLIELDKYILEFPYPTLDSIILYEPISNSGYQVHQGGDLLPFSERTRNHRNVTFEQSIPENERLTYYVRIESEGALQLPIVLWKVEAFTDKSLIEYLLFGLYFGITTGMVIYNLFLYFSLRFKSYLWYVIFICVLCLSQLAFSGLAYQYLWPESIWWNNRAIVFFLALTGIAGMVFVDKFLKIRLVSKKLWQWFYFLIVIYVFLIALLMINYKLALILIIIYLNIIIVFVLFTIVMCWRKGHTAARFLFLGWTIFLISIFLTLLSNAGILPVNFLTNYASMIGAVVEMILFSLALADRMNMFEQEKDKAEIEALKNKEMAFEHLKRVNRLKDEFLANTTHELRTPLYGMIGIAESLRDGVAGEPNPILKYNLSLIINSGQRLSNLLNDLLDYSKLRSHEIKLNKGPVRLQDAANLVINIIEPLTTKKDIQLINKIPQDLRYAYADENRVQQILHNLIGNAVKFTDVGQVVIIAEVIKDVIEVKIIDSGIGMTEIDLQIAFNEFQQGSQVRKRQQSGTGLGLSITKDLVHLHGGEISLNSEVGNGTTVTFTLPVYEGTVSEMPSISPYIEDNKIEKVVNHFSFKTKRKIKGNILIADDDPVNIQVLTNHLNLNGYELVVARDGEEVIQIIRSMPTFDLVILDVMMPKLTGYEVCQEIRKKYSLTELPVLILTARSQLKDVVTAFEAGANDYLIKPYFKEELLARVETLLTLKQVMEEVLEKSHELYSLNEELEERVKSRTKELEIKTEELITMEKSRRHLLSNISHDLGTPMTAVQGYVKAMIDEVIEPNSHYLNIIYERTLYIGRLLQDLYDLSSLEAKQASFFMEYIKINNFVDELLHGFEDDVTANNIAFELENKWNARGNDNLALYVDLDRIRQVMENLVSNAVKYAKEGGIIRIEVIGFEDFYISHQENKEYFTEIAAALDGQEEKHLNSLVIGVHDNGVGIDSSFLPYIFNRYYRADSENYSKYRNAGLGLSIAKEIIDYHQGVIWVESVKTKGSSFYFTLPTYFSEEDKEE